MGQKGKPVKFLYVGTLDDGTVFDDCNDIPYEIILGKCQVMKVLDETLSSMSPGEEKTVRIAPKDAYGEYNNAAVQIVPIFKIPHGESMPVGETIAWKTPRSADPIPAKVLKIENQVATLDFNHPLAGKNITYWVKVID